MIHISPAILTNSESEFDRQMAAYSKFAQQIDIDINLAGDHFYGDPTVDVSLVAGKLKPGEVTYGIHLMVSDPYQQVVKFLELAAADLAVIFYVHQETPIADVQELDLPETYKLAVVVKAESELEDLSFYQQFPEVQLMTIETGRQGNPFKPEVLDRAEQLRSSGYQGLISVDGSINLETAVEVNKHSVDRVSVGSFLSQAEDAAENYQQLNSLLNGNTSNSVSPESVAEDIST